jgi:hypothetical protein
MKADQNKLPNRKAAVSAPNESSTHPPRKPYSRPILRVLGPHGKILSNN